MILLRYNPAKLLLMSVFLLFFLVPLVLIFLYPEELEQSRRGLARLMSTGLGHDVVLPALIGLCLLFMWRCTATAMGRRVAIEAKEDAVHVTDLWGTKRIPWAQLAPLRIERTSTLSSTSYRLIFRGDGATAKVPVGMTELRDAPLEPLVVRIEAMRRGSGRPEAALRRPVRTAAAAAGPAGFGRKRS